MISELAELTADSVGYVPEKNLIGTRWKHSGNGHVYTIEGFIWCGEYDRWHIAHTREQCDLRFSRSPENFFGWRSNGEVRYRPVLTV